MRHGDIFAPTQCVVPRGRGPERDQSSKGGVFWALLLGWLLVHGPVTVRAQPANDDCNAAQSISTLPFAEVIDVSTATTELSDPLLSCTGGVQGNNSVWYTVTATGDDTIGVSTAGSSYDTAVAVHSGTCGSLTEIECNDTFKGSPTAELAFNASAGETYLIEVVARGAGATLSLSVQAVECGDGILGPTEECDDGNTESGDGCSEDCESELVPGGGGLRYDCLHEWLTEPIPELNEEDLPENSLECTDDDPTCDFGAVSGDQACTFHVAMCFNVTEKRFNCSPSDIMTVALKGKGRGSIDAANRNALEEALLDLGGISDPVCANRGAYYGLPCATDSDCNSQPTVNDGWCRRVVLFPPLAEPIACTPFVQIVVPLRQTAAGLRPRTKNLGLLVAPSISVFTPSVRIRDHDRFRLVCQPGP